MAGQATSLKHGTMRQGHMAVNSFTCCVRGGTVLAETTAQHRRRQLPRLSSALFDIVLRLRSLYSCLVLHLQDVLHQQLPPFRTGNMPGSGLGGRPKIHSPGPPTRKLRDSAQYCLVQAFVIKAMNVRVTQERTDFSTSL